MQNNCILASSWKSTGYGNGKENHRVAWVKAYGPIPKGFDVDHICHNEDPTCAGGKTCVHRRCYNIEHLRLATRSENLRAGQVYSGETNERRSAAVHLHWSSVDKTDMTLKGRADADKGWASPYARLPAVCIECGKRCKGIRALNAHYTKMHGKVHV